MRTTGTTCFEVHIASYVKVWVNSELPSACIQPRHPVQQKSGVGVTPRPTKQEFTPFNFALQGSNLSLENWCTSTPPRSAAGLPHYATQYEFCLVPPSPVILANVTCFAAMAAAEKGNGNLKSGDIFDIPKDRSEVSACSCCSVVPSPSRVGVASVGTRFVSGTTLVQMFEKT